MSRFDCVVMGSESLLLHCTEMLLARGHAVRAVVTDSPEVASWAQGRDLRVETPGAGLAERLGRFDWLLSIANLRLISAEVLDLARKGAVNFHDGPLPRHAGLNAPVWAMLEGEATHGVAWHLIAPGVDTGDVLVRQDFDIAPDDTALSLNTKAYEAAMASFPALVDQLETGLAPVPQDMTGRSFHARADRPAGFGLIDVRATAGSQARLVRALDFGPYWNPLCVAKLPLADGLLRVGGAESVPSAAAPGTVLETGADSLTVAFDGGALRLTGLTHLCGAPVTGLPPAGTELPAPTPQDIDAAQAAAALVVRGEASARAALAAYAPGRVPGLTEGQGAVQRHPLHLPASAGRDAVALWARRLSGADTVDIGFADAALETAAATGLVSPWALLRCGPEGAGAPQPFASDLTLRAPELDALKAPQLGLSEAGHVPGTALTVILGEAPALSYDDGRVSPAWAALLAARLDLWAANPEAGLPEAEIAMQTHGWNATEVPLDGPATMPAAFEAQVARTPDAVVLVFEDVSLSYADLDARANRAAHLLRAMEVGPGQVVGLCTRRTPDLVIGALAILKAGGAYLPLDPAYPADRLQHMLQDSAAQVIVTQAAVEPALPRHSAQVLVLDAEPRLAEMPDTPPEATAGPEDLAYLIYTSGSTGTPKGVMVEHRNVLNFYAGMDAHVPATGVWLAVTSLSFDISVLELFWTTARGMTVVLAGDDERALLTEAPKPRAGGMEFSLYYWGNDDGVGRDKYRLLLEGAKFADENGFVAVWTPERHFHAFGGPYPNPSVTGAAVAAVTQNLAVRSGSVVAPLHHPARIAEEWAVIDNLTNGRAGLAIASGWQPDDFILRPENTPPDNKPAMMRDLDMVRRLWRGEAVEFPRNTGEMHAVVTQPRPVSPELPIWLTIAGNPKTWEDAGRHGCHVLTHLLGQSIDEVGEKIKIYHAALREAGHDPKDFKVTLMLHTFLAESRDKAREMARGPMKAYLNAAAGLIKQYAWVFPAFKRPEGVSNAFDLKLDGLAPEELDAILDFAFERYFNDSGLFGTVEDALARAEQVKAIGVTEIACLIDYGIDRAHVLDGLKPLAEVVARCQADSAPAEADFSLPAQIERHGVTHLQCTPSMARMFAAHAETRRALKDVRHLFLGGEPLPGALVAEYAQFCDATVTNMYGPTEATVWSSCSRAAPVAGVVDIGRPLANQRMYVLDAARRPVGVGDTGELWIGGAGVTRGYWNRPELTAERFVEDSFHGGRMYRTGDLVRRRADGALEFLGRADFQVKLRGYRIELGEIEAALEACPGVSHAVAAAREDVPGDLRLVGYVTGTAEESALKAALATRLPAFMVPGRIVTLPALPMTPNGKVDRAALPAPAAAAAVKPARPAAPVASSPVAAPRAAPDRHTGLEAQVAAIWTRFLGVAAPRPDDNFFDLGGHSLLAVQVHRALREELGAEALSITDIFRLPVLSDLSAKLAGMVAGPAAPAPVAPVAAAETVPGQSRAQSRAAAMAKRREMRARRRA